jgi:hypothetical protein
MHPRKKQKAKEEEQQELLHLTSSLKKIGGWLRKRSNLRRSVADEGVELSNAQVIGAKFRELKAYLSKPSSH